MELTHINDCYTLNNGVRIPCVAFGTYKAADGKSAEIIRTAIQAGYRSFDTASFYGTEPYLAQAVRESGVPRSDFFYTSKVWKAEMGYHQTLEAFRRTLDNLETDYLDLYLIHWPLPAPDCRDWQALDLETWRAMEELYAAGKVRAIGVSNFLPHHIENLLEHGSVPPAVDQLEFHPGHTQEAAVRYCQAHGIRVQAWSPIGRSRVLEDPLILELAAKYRVSPARICLRYAVEKGVIPLPKSSSLPRMKENQDLFSFSLSTGDLYRLDTMPPVGWSGEHPDRERVYLN